MSDVKITEKDAKNIIINLICNKLFILAPLYLKQSSGGWAFIITTIIFIVITTLWNVWCNNCYKSITNLISQKYIKKIFVILVLIISTLITAITIRQYSMSLKTSVLHTSPYWFLSLIFVTAMIIGAKSSLKGISATCNLLVPPIYLTAFFLIVLSVSRNDIYNFFPILNTSNNKIFSKIFLILSIQYELIFLYFIPDFLKQPQRTRRTGNIAIFLSYMYFLVISIVYSITLTEVEITSHIPFFRIIRMAHFGDKTTNFDSIFLILYCLSSYIYISSILALMIRIANSNFSKKVSSYIKYIIVFAIIILSTNRFCGEKIFYFFSNNYGILFITTFVIPTIILLLNKVQKCKLKD